MRNCLQSLAPDSIYTSVVIVIGFCLKRKLNFFVYVISWLCINILMNGIHENRHTNTSSAIFSEAIIPDIPLIIGWKKHLTDKYWYNILYFICFMPSNSCFRSLSTKYDNTNIRIRHSFFSTPVHDENISFTQKCMKRECCKSHLTRLKFSNFCHISSALKTKQMF